jgi:competence protein ComEA
VIGNDRDIRCFEEVIRMQGARGGRNSWKDPKRVKLLIIVVAVVGIAAVTLADRSADEDAGDVLYAGQPDGAADDAPGTGQDGTGAAGGDAREEQAAASGSEDVAGEATGTSGAAAVSETIRIFVDVCGAVRSPAVYELGPGSRVYEAIEAAGGLAEAADIRYINRAAALVDGDRVYIPTAEEVASGEPLPGSAGLVGASSGAAQGGQSAANGGSDGTAQVNINTADATALQTLNGVGPATAQKILDYRDQHGPFAKIEDLKNVSGIGEKTFEKLKDHIRV